MTAPVNPDQRDRKKFFGTDGIRGRVGVAPITPELILKLGWAVGRIFAEESNHKVVIGKDPRISGYLLESALEAGLSAAGADILLLGPMPTPGIAYLTRHLEAQAGIVISASHNPYYDNGIKLFDANGSKLPDEKEFAIEAYLEQPLRCVDSKYLGKATRIDDAAQRYIDFCLSTLKKPLDLTKYKIILDCANGATYSIAPKLFKQLGAQVSSIGISPDGLNINADCGSTYPQALQQRVLAESADLGIAFDGDGDRVIFIDRQGRIVDGDQIVFILAEYLKRQGLLAGGVIGTVMSNLGLERALQQRGIEFVRSAVGDRHVMTMLKTRGWFLGGESSGHIINLQLSPTGDGLLTALQILSILAQTGQPLSDLVQPMQRFPQVLLNVALPAALDTMQQDQLHQISQRASKSLNGSGRVLLRLSGTEPVIRIMVEGEDPQVVQALAESLVKQVEGIFR